MTVSAGGWVVLCADGTEHSIRTADPSLVATMTEIADDARCGPHTVARVLLLSGPLAEDEALVSAVTAALREGVAFAGGKIPERYAPHAARFVLAAVDAAIGEREQ